MATIIKDKTIAGPAKLAAVPVITKIPVTSCVNSNGGQLPKPQATA